MSVADRIAKFFVEQGDLQTPEEHVPRTSQENQVTYLIDGASYFDAIRAEVNALRAQAGAGRFFFVANWVLALVDFDYGQAALSGQPSAWNASSSGSAFKLRDPQAPTSPLLIDELADLMAKGVDVRVLGFVSPYLLTLQEAAQAASVTFAYSVSTMLSVNALRQREGLARKAFLNCLAHPLGSMHLKLVVCGDNTTARGFVSGMDFYAGRDETRQHSGSGGGWHDIAARVQGPAVDALYGYFRLQWNEQLKRDVERFRIDDMVVASHDVDADEVPDRTFAPVPAGTHRVQVLRTAPRMRFALGATPVVPLNCFSRLLVGGSRPPLSYAPNGIFEFRAALRKAIGAAESYIYVEDQSLTSREIMGWINERLIANPDVRVIMVFSSDPNDPAEFVDLLWIAINEYLVPNVQNVSDRLAFYLRTDDVTTHSKVWIIDDEIAIIGSANAMQRSLYTDAELSLSIVDETDGTGAFPVLFRSDLWAEYCGLFTDADRLRFASLNDALRIWRNTWSTGGVVGTAPGALTAAFQYKQVPFVSGTGFGEWQRNPVVPPHEELDRFYESHDADSRKEF